MEALKKAVEEISEKTKNKITNDLEKLSHQADKIIEKYYKETISKTKEIEDEYARKIESMKRMIISNAEMQVRNKLLQLYSEYVDKAIDLALNEIKKNREVYLKSLRKLLLEALNNVGEKKVIVYCNPEDRKEIERLSSEIIKDKGVKMDIRAEEISKYGGVIVTNESGTISFNNTIEARLMRMKEDIRKNVGEVLRR